jgi:hypothetical protein
MKRRISELACSALADSIQHNRNFENLVALGRGICNRVCARGFPKKGPGDILVPPSAAKTQSYVCIGTGNRSAVSVWSALSRACLHRAVPNLDGFL